MIDRAAAMAIYAYNAVSQAHEHNGETITIPQGLAERLADQTYTDVLRYSLDECACVCHQEHETN